MKRETLKALGLTDEQIESVMAENGKDVGAEVAKVTTANATVEDLQKQLTARDEDLKELQTSAGTNEELKTKYEALQTKYTADSEALTKQIADIKLDSALDRAISEVKGRNGKAIKALLNREALKLTDDGKLEGLDLKALQESDPYLFEITQTKTQGTEPTSGNGTPNKGISQAVFSQHINDVRWMQDNLDAVTQGLSDGTLSKG